MITFETTNSKATFSIKVDDADAQDYTANELRLINIAGERFSLREKNTGIDIVKNRPFSDAIDIETGEPYVDFATLRTFINANFFNKPGGVAGLTSQTLTDDVTINTAGHVFGIETDSEIGGDISITPEQARLSVFADDGYSSNITATGGGGVSSASLRVNDNDNQQSSVNVETDGMGVIDLIGRIGLVNDDDYSENIIANDNALATTKVVKTLSGAIDSIDYHLQTGTQLLQHDLFENDEILRFDAWYVINENAGDPEIKNQIQVEFTDHEGVSRTLTIAEFGDVGPCLIPSVTIYAKGSTSVWYYFQQSNPDINYSGGVSIFRLKSIVAP